MDIHNTDVIHFPLTLTVTDATGAKTTKPIPAGDVFTAVSSSPSLAVSVGLDASGNQEVVGSPTVLESDAANGGGGITIHVTDSAGDTAADVTGADAINIIVVPPVPQIALGTPTFTTQAAPTAPGP